MNHLKSGQKDTETSLSSDLAKTKIVTLALKMINSKSMSKTTFTRGEFVRVRATFHLTIFMRG